MATEVAPAREAAATPLLDEPRRAPPRPGWRLLGECSVVAGLNLLLVTWLYRLWEASPRVPLTDWGDAKQIEMVIKGIHENGWWLQNPSLGAPFGQLYYEFPHGGENLQLLLIKGLVSLTGDPGLTLNLYYLAGFALVALSAFLVCRYLGFSFKVALLIATLYTFLPYHMFHEVNHLFRSTYLNVPLAALLLLWTLSPWERFQRHGRPPAGWRGWQPRWGRVAAALSICVLLGSWETMLAAFTIALLASAGLLLAVAHREPQRLLVHGILAAVIGVTFLVNNAPSLRYMSAHGKNELAANREAWESEFWGLKISKMILPVHDGRTRHRIDALDDIGRETEVGPIPSEGGQALGVIGAVGFLAAVGGLLVRLLRRSRDDPLDGYGLLTVLAVLFGTIGGFSFLVALAGFAQVRMWNRMAILIAFFALLVVGTGLERVLRRWRPATGALVVGALLVVGLLDQTSSQARPYDQFDAQFSTDRDFVRRIEQRLPADAAVFQFPIIPFPESPAVNFMLDYDHLQGYLHSTDLRWSYGGVKGRPRADWQQRLQQLPPEVQVAALAAIGFDGIWVDRFGYPNKDSPLEDVLASTLGRGPTFVSDDGRVSFWDLRHYRARLERERTPRDLEQLTEGVLGEPSPLNRNAASD